MKLNVFHIILMILCLSALIISSETIKFYNRLDNFADFDLSLLSSKKRNEYLHDFYNKKYEESKKLEKNIPKKYTPYQGYNTWNECNKVHYLFPGDKFKKIPLAPISYCFPPDPVMSLPKYRILNTKELCVSDLDIAKKNKIPGLWSPPCTKNDECPFYKSNKNYKNEFGKCIKGKCEQPLGVVPIGNKHYIGNPLCHRCVDSDEPSDCCKLQDNRDLYKNIMSPDYAFKNDEISRYENLKI
jgi:hypothetical protein